MYLYLRTMTRGYPFRRLYASSGAWNSRHEDQEGVIWVVACPEGMGEAGAKLRTTARVRGWNRGNTRMRTWKTSHRRMHIDSNTRLIGRVHHLNISQMHCNMSLSPARNYVLHTNKGSTLF